MRSINLKNIRILLSLGPVHTSTPRHLFPPHWKSNQRIPVNPKTIGENIRRYRLELYWLQIDVAKKIGISSKSVSNWERGITSPSRGMTKKIQKFFNFPPKPTPKIQRNIFCCQICGISNVSTEPCLFERTCKSFTENSMSSQVHTTDPVKVRARCCLFVTAQ
jgi:transcriptional regulator with XRE-family HTH domain